MNERTTNWVLGGLKRLGYPSIVEDGNWGEIGSAALARFRQQQEYNNEDDGILRSEPSGDDVYEIFHALREEDFKPSLSNG